MRLGLGLFVAGMGVIFLGLSLNEPHRRDIPVEVMYAAVGAIWLVAAAMLFFVFKSYKALKVDEENIYYGDRVIPFGDIDKLMLNAELYTFWTGTSEGVIIKLKTGEDVTIKVDAYSNGRIFRQTGDRIKKQIEIGIYKLDTNEPGPEVKPEGMQMDDLRNEHFTKFFANLLLLPDFWLLGIAVTAFFVIKNWSKQESIMDPYALLLLLAAAFGINFLTMPNYFLVSENYLVIKKRLFFWKPTIIPMKDIRRISIYSTQKGGSGIEVLDAEHRLHVYRAGIIFSNKLDDLIKMVNAHAPIEK